ncbi:acyl-CoA thioester hydrolase/BAAT C-terminal domain-containing protein [Saliphagus sp. LR7]|uniref:acyl-CoA thioester hydrolase/BAAT C-terminal domain-containing protein n=1 Tax=Saliphagus sp. LR7 TaxID=2282654 RepID=UPI002102AF66|nr:acyl-CoA thioester hydrolase/BAAT C-terminal domain-containing protein [Saliphagus sp. LR7]
MGNNQQTSTRVRIDIPNTTRLDERFVPRITGIEPHDHVTLTTSTSDGVRDWSTTATFEADEEGVVDLASIAPVGGSYDRADSMGPIWSMTTEDGEPHRFEFTPLGSHDVTFTAEADDRSATESVTIHHGDPGVTRHTVDEPGIEGSWFEPEVAGPHPGVLVLHGSGGRPMETTAALLASHGFAAFSLQYLEVLDLPDRPIGVPVSYVHRAADWFRDRDAIAGDGLGIYGASMGGQLALLFATLDEEIDAVVSDAGANLVFSSGETAPWTVDGEPHPRIDIREEPAETWDRYVDGAPVKREMWIQMLEAASTDQRRAATIPIEETEAALLFLSGSDDAIWPAPTFGNMALARLDALQYDRKYDHLVYHDAGHCIGYPYRPTTWRPIDEGLVNGGDPAAHADAQTAAWPRVLGFLNEELSTGEPSDHCERGHR